MLCVFLCCPNLLVTDEPLSAYPVYAILCTNLYKRLGVYCAKQVYGRCVTVRLRVYGCDHEDALH